MSSLTSTTTMLTPKRICLGFRGPNTCKAGSAKATNRRVSQAGQIGSVQRYALSDQRVTALLRKAYGNLCAKILSATVSESGSLAKICCVS